MTAASTTTSILFAALVLVMSAIVARTLWIHGATDRDGPARYRLPVLVILLYLVIPTLLAASGRLDSYELPPPAMLLVGALTILTVGGALSPIGDRLSRSIGLAALVGFQAFRIPVELLLHQLAAEGVIPFNMTYVGRNLDILTGLSAAALGFILTRRNVFSGILITWNVVGLLLLLNIVAIAVLSTPVPFRVFAEGPPNLLPSTFPFVWLPTFLVQLALFGHLLLFRRLAADARSHPAG